MPHTADAVVVGAGIIGSSVALELTRGGRSVLVVGKAGDVGHGSTSASSAIIRFSYSTFEGVALAWEAWRSWPGHLGHRDPAGLATYHPHRAGPPHPRRRRPRPGRRAVDRVSVPWQLWGPAEPGRRLPGLDTGSFGPPKPVDSEELFAVPHRRAASQAPTNDATPVRFDAPHTGHTLSLGAFSRLRRVADGAPSSVMG